MLLSGKARDHQLSHCGGGGWRAGRLRRPPERVQESPLAEQNNSLHREWARSPPSLPWSAWKHRRRTPLGTPHKLAWWQSFHFNHKHKTAAEPGGKLSPGCERGETTSPHFPLWWRAGPGAGAASTSQKESAQVVVGQSLWGGDG